MKKLFAALALATTFTANAAENVQSFPQSPVTIIVPLAPGGGLDSLARVIAQYLGERWNQPVIVANRPGVGGWVGAQATANAKPDGHTLLIAHDALVVANKFLSKNQLIDLEKDLAPVTPLVQANQMLLANLTPGVDDLAQFVKLAKSEPGKYAFGTFGPGSTPQLAWTMLAHKENLDLLDVPYKGISAIMQALLGNEVQLSIGSGAVAGNLLEAGRLKALAVASLERDPNYPNVKTTTELGFPYLQLSIWHSLHAPGGTPLELRKKIAADVQAVLKNPELQKKIPHFIPQSGGPEELAKRIREESVRMKEMIEVAGVQPQ